VALNECAAKQVHELEAQLARALTVEASYFDKTSVASAQRAWTGYEVAECRLEQRPYSGGTIQPLVYAECERGLLIQRITLIRSDVGAVHR
jgi:uncharacterized protein YecT (DUF1311 family)